MGEEFAIACGFPTLAKGMGWADAGNDFEKNRGRFESPAEGHGDVRSDWFISGEGLKQAFPYLRVE